MLRWAGATASVTLASGAVLFGLASPASANTNFNAKCESSEACVYNWDYHEGHKWDYEGTDTNFTNNYYPDTTQYGEGPRLDNSAAAFDNYGTGCSAVFGQNVGGRSSQGWIIKLPVGGQSSVVNNSKNNQASSLWWEC
jgi:hypothetical protein